MVLKRFSHLSEDLFTFLNLVDSKILSKNCLPLSVNQLLEELFANSGSIFTI